MTHRRKKMLWSLRLLAGTARICWFLTLRGFSALSWTAVRLHRRVAIAKKRAKAHRVVEKRQRASGAVCADFGVRKTVVGSYVELAEALRTRSSIILLFGRRGSGKSTLGFRLLENIRAQTGRPCFVLGVKQALLPAWASAIERIDAVAEGGVALVDEGALAFGSRESMQRKNIALGKLLAIARHRDMTLIFITQNTGMIDKSVLNLADVVLAKEGSLLQQQMERAVLRTMVRKADAAIKAVPKEERVTLAYAFSDDFEGLLSVPLPSFWSQAISKNQAAHKP